MLEWLRAVEATAYAKKARADKAAPLYKGLMYAGTFHDGTRVYCSLTVLSATPLGILFADYSNVKADGTRDFQGSHRLILCHLDGEEEEFRKDR